MKKTLKYILAFLIWLTLILPLIQKLTGVYPERELSGDFIRAGKPELSLNSWYSGVYQADMNDFIDENIGLHNTLVRLNNQLDFTLFGIVKAEGVVKGKDNYLFEYDYIRGKLGLDFTGERFIEEKLRRMKFLQEHLEEEYGTVLALVLEPSKARFFPGKLPEEHKGKPAGSTNYGTYKRLAEQLGVNLLDFNEYYLEMKDTASYPLYPPYGIHWSLYGMTFCADSILRYIDDNWPHPLNGYSYDFYTSSVPERTDNDVEKALNLLFPLPSPELAYPSYEFTDGAVEQKPNVLVVADSYYFNIFNTGIPENIFNNQAFWYFNARVYPDYYYSPTLVEDVDLKKETEKQDFIFLMVTERFLHRFDWHFIDNLYDVYAPAFLRYPEYEYFNDVVNNDDLFKKLVARAKEGNEPLDELIWENAYFLFMEKEWADFMMLHGLERQVEIIRNDSTWYGHIIEKATEQDIPVTEMLRRDAEYVFRQNYPDLFRINEGIRSKRNEIFIYQETSQEWDHLMKEYYLKSYRAQEVLAQQLYFEERIGGFEEAIRNDKAWFEHVRNKAEDHGLPLDEMIKIDAEYMLEQELDDLRNKYD